MRKYYNQNAPQSIKNGLFALALCLCFQNKAAAQYWEAGLTTGYSSCIGDLQPSIPPSSDNFGLSYGAFVRRNISTRVSAKVLALKGQFYAADRYATNNRRLRGLETTTDFYELSAMLEWNILPFEIMAGKTTTPYLVIGAGGTYFSPTAKLFGTKYKLRDLGTEGQTLPGGKKYMPFTASFPVGLGFKVAMGKRFIIGFEGGLRPTLTDYLDDVSKNYPDLAALKEQNANAAALSFRMEEVVGHKLNYPSGQLRGDKYAFDFYYYGGLTVSYNLASPRDLEFNKTYREFLK
jgi:hypothetical protein